MRKHRQVRSLAVMFVATWGFTAVTAQDEPKLANPVKADAKAVDLELLCRKWVHSYEEEKPGDNSSLYHPAEAKKFGPSRFRMQYVFSRNGDCEWYWLAPDDGHKMRPGKWMLDPKDPAMVRIDTDQGKMSFRVVALTKDELRLVMMERIPGQ